MNYIDIIFKTLTSIAAIIAIFQLIEVRRKRLIDLYWKIADIYATDEQRSARKNLWHVKTKYLDEIQNNVKIYKELVDLYNHEYHITAKEENKKIDSSILHRIRFLNQIGVLLKRRLIDKDMLFGLIGVGLELDYSTIRVVLDAHRMEHNVPHMYLDFENTWIEYQKWKEKRKLA